MANQLRFDLRSASAPDAIRIPRGCSIPWRKVERRARKLVREVIGLRAQADLSDGFAVRGYARDAALLETLRRQLAGKRLKQAARHSGRMPVQSPVLFALSPEGRQLHALVDRIEERIAKQEALILCG